MSRYNVNFFDFEPLSHRPSPSLCFIHYQYLYYGFGYTQRIWVIMREGWVDEILFVLVNLKY